MPSLCHLSHPSAADFPADIPAPVYTEKSSGRSVVLCSFAVLLVHLLLKFLTPVQAAGCMVNAIN